MTLRPKPHSDARLPVSRNTFGDTSCDHFDPPRAWVDTVRQYPAVVLFRRVIELDAPAASATLRLFAESGYILWVNGMWIGRGPTNRHPHRLPVRAYALAEHLRPGRNVIAVLVAAYGEPMHHYVPTGKPGLAAELTVEYADGRRATWDTGDGWKATARSGWRSNVPRRSWATGHVEVFDAGEAPDDWQALDYDDDWPLADVYDTARPAPDGRYIAEELPPLRATFVPAAALLRFDEVQAPPVEIAVDFAHGTYGTALKKTPRRTPQRARLDGALDEQGGGLCITGLSTEIGAVLDLDLGAEYAGQSVLELESDTAGVIDFGWSERLDDGAPAVNQMGSSFANQIHAVPGVTRFASHQFNAGRYLSLFLRGFVGRVRIHRVGWRATEPDLDWGAAHFQCNDDDLNQLFHLGVRTLAVGTQESLTDCPTREKATYIGDGMPAALWIAMITGDARHWTHLMREQFMRPSSEGLLRSTTFSGRLDTLIDYPLLAVVWAALYQRRHRDSELLHQILPACRNVVDYFDRHCDARGLFNWHWSGPLPAHQWETVYGAQPLHFGDHLNLFIDHAGMGWHKPGGASLDRRGINAAINTLRVRAMCALAELEDAAGDAAAAESWRERAASLGAAVRDAFYDTDRAAFVDGELEGRRLEQVSQQTNTWAIWSRIVEGDRAAALAQRILRADPERVTPNGPYFWTYFYPVLKRHGLVGDALDTTRHLYRHMLRNGATTLWETGAGGDTDSRCHPWSAACLQYLLCGLAGLPTGLSATARRTLTPQPQLRHELSASINLPEGRYTIAWRVSGDTVELSGTLPEGVEADLCAGDGSAIATVRARWRQVCKLDAFDAPAARQWMD